MQMSGYTKLFSSILASTIWQESKETKIIWITMLAAANKDGAVEASIPGLAHMARLTVPETEEALAVLMMPDPYSRTPAFEGRRIEKCDGGWQILNHDKYREQMSAAERTEYNRLKQQESRERKRAREAESVKSASANVSKCQSRSASQRQEEAKASPKEKEDSLCDADTIYDAYPKKVSKPDAIKAIRKALAGPPLGVDTETWPQRLLQLTRDYAVAVRGQDRSFIPFPATWFNGQRYNDDPSTWKNGGCKPADSATKRKEFFS